MFRDLSRQFADRWIGKSILTDAINHERTEFILDWFSRIGTNAALTEMFPSPRIRKFNMLTVSGRQFGELSRNWYLKFRSRQSA